MSKYIDTDKLKERVTRLIASARQNDWPIAEDYLRRVIDTIDSLQQEQQKPSGYDKALLEVKSLVDKLYDEASIGLNEYDSGLYNGIAETCMKLRGFIKARLDSDEQPEVDLEKEIDAIWNPRFNLGWDEHSALSMNHAGFASIARHFYELGINARKEE